MTLRVWDLENGICQATFLGEAGICALAVAHDGTIVCGDNSGRVYILELVESKKTKQE